MHDETESSMISGAADPSVTATPPPSAPATAPSASPPTARESATVTVGIATYRRPTELRRLLVALRTIERPSASLSWVRTVVIDNSPEAGARGVVDAVDGIPGLTYVHEPEPGLSAARNAAVANAEADWVAFIDDDEVPDAQWLVELERTVGRWPDARAVVGPVAYAFDEPQPRWLEQTRLFEPLELVEGEPPHYFATGNAMVRSDLIDQLGPLFDPYFGQLGGEDHHLGLRLQAIDALVVSSPLATVTEFVPPERVDTSWAVKRMLRKGSSLALTETRLLSGRRRIGLRLRHVAAGVARIVQGLALLVTVPFVSGRTPWLAYRSIVMGVGQISGALDHPIHEYRRVPSSEPSVGN